MAGSRWALAAVTGAITMTLIGGAAVAAFQPFSAADQTTQRAVGAPSDDLADRGGPQARIKAALDALVKNGTITQAQEDSILQALKDATPTAKPTPARPRGPSVGAYTGDLSRSASAYLGLTPKELATRLRTGTSVGAVADGIPGKSSAELIALLTKAATDRIDRAVAAKKLTADQAAALRPKVAAAIAAFVQRPYRNPAKRSLPATPTPSPRP